jgi:hypothetical protein
MDMDIAALRITNIMLGETDLETEAALSAAEKGSNEPLFSTVQSA